MSLPTSPSAIMRKHPKLVLNLSSINQNTSVFSYISPKSWFNYSEASLIQQQTMHRQLEQKAILLKQKEKKLKSTLREVQKNNPTNSQNSNLCITNKLGTNKHKRSQTFDFPTQPTENRSNNASLSRIPSEDSLENNDVSREINIIYKCLGEGIEKQNKELTELKQITQKQTVQISKLSSKLRHAESNAKELQQKNVNICQELTIQKQAYMQLLTQLKQQQQKRLALQSKLRQIQKIIFNPQSTKSQ